MTRYTSGCSEYPSISRAADVAHDKPIPSSRYQDGDEAMKQNMLGRRDFMVDGEGGSG
jgi:hypothetical protein